MEEQITFVKAAIGDPDVDRLLLKLDQARFPKDALLIEIKNLYVTVNKVYDGKNLAGILVVRAFQAYNRDLCLEIDHLIAEDHPARAFGDVLKQSLFQWVASAGFDRIFQHTHTPALARALKSVYGEPQEFIFSKDLRSLKRTPSVKGVENG